MTELEQRLRTIVTEKEEKLLPENLKKGITLLGVTGTLEESSGGSYNTIKIIDVVTDITVSNPTASTGKPFTYDGEYYVSTNTGVASSYSLAKVEFEVLSTGSFKLHVISESEHGYDFGIFSKIDTTLTDDFNADSSNVYVSLKSQGQTIDREIEYTDVTPGNHFIYIKYRKDGSGNTGTDTLKFKLIPTTTINLVNCPVYYSMEEMNADTSKDADTVGVLVDEVSNIKKSYVWDGEVWNLREQLNETSDATAEAADILLGKTAYSKGELLTGTFGGAKFFASKEEMDADPRKRIGDMAMIYSIIEAGITSDKPIESIKFPNTVVLDTAITSSVYGYLRGSSYEDEYSISLSASSFSIMNEWEWDYLARYTSSDGITYTKSSGQDEYTFSSPVTFSGTWNDAFGEFMRTGSNSFEGIFECEEIPDNTRVSMAGNFVYDTENAAWTFEQEDVYISDFIPIADWYSGVLVKKSDTIFERYNGFYSSSYAMISGKIYLMTSIGSAVTSCTVEKTTYDIENRTKTTEDITVTLNSSVLGYSKGSENYNKYYVVAELADTDLLSIKPYSNSAWGSFSLGYTTNALGASTAPTSKSVDYSKVYTVLVYNPATTQLSNLDATKLLPGTIAYGNNGIVESDGTFYTQTLDPEVITNVLGSPVTELPYKYIMNQQLQEWGDEKYYGIKKYVKSTSDDFTLLVADDISAFDVNKSWTVPDKDYSSASGHSATAWTPDFYCEALQYTYSSSTAISFGVVGVDKTGNVYLYHNTNTSIGSAMLANTHTFLWNNTLYYLGSSTNTGNVSIYKVTSETASTSVLTLSQCTPIGLLGDTLHLFNANEHIMVDMNTMTKTTEAVGHGLDVQLSGLARTYVNGKWVGRFTANNLVHVVICSDSGLEIKEITNSNGFYVACAFGNDDDIYFMARNENEDNTWGIYSLGEDNTFVLVKKQTYRYITYCDNNYCYIGGSGSYCAMIPSQDILTKTFSTYNTSSSYSVNIFGDRVITHSLATMHGTCYVRGYKGLSYYKSTTDANADLILFGCKNSSSSDTDGSWNVRQSPSGASVTMLTGFGHRLYFEKPEESNELSGEEV